jgi:hypothetical protein
LPRSDGAGGNFSAGADLDRLVGAMIAGKPAENEFEDRIRADASLIYKGFLKEHRPATPIIAAVEGYCYAGGIEILQAFDVRVAAEGARIAVSEVQRGLFPMSADGWPARIRGPGDGDADHRGHLGRRAYESACGPRRPRRHHLERGRHRRPSPPTDLSPSATSRRRAGGRRPARRGLPA